MVACHKLLQTLLERLLNVIYVEHMCFVSKARLYEILLLSKNTLTLNVQMFIRRCSSKQMFLKVL